MTGSIAARFRWAMEVLALEPADRVLEIGCGHGIAAGLIAERLTSGCVIGIDRSAKMIALAQRRNEAFVRDGRAVFHQGSVEDRPLPDDSRFQRALAINVALFSEAAHPGITAVRDLLTPNGTCCVVFQPPTAAKLESLEAAIGEALTFNGFIVRDVRRAEHLTMPITAVIASAPSAN